MKNMTLRPHPRSKTKKLYSLLKHSKQDPSGIAVLKANAKTYTADTDKVSACTSGSLGVRDSQKLAFDFQNLMPGSQ